MLRIVIENILIFLIPTLLYAAYVLMSSPANDEHLAERTVARVLDEAPLLWLFTAGAVLVVLSLIAFRGFDGGAPGQQYQAPTLSKDGRIEPGHVK